MRNLQQATRIAQPWPWPAARAMPLCPCCAAATPPGGLEADTGRALKGGAATQVSTGARQDLKQATRIARMAVAECGMSEAVGPVFVERGGGAGAPASADLERRVDGEVGRMLREAHARVTALLVQPLRWALGHVCDNRRKVTRESGEVLAHLQAPTTRNATWNQRWGHEARGARAPLRKASMACLRTIFSRAVRRQSCPIPCPPLVVPWSASEEGHGTRACAKLAGVVEACPGRVQAASNMRCAGGEGARAARAGGRAAGA